MALDVDLQHDEIAVANNGDSWSACSAGPPATPRGPRDQRRTDGIMGPIGRLRREARRDLAGHYGTPRSSSPERQRALAPKRVLETRSPGGFYGNSAPSRMTKRDEILVPN
jgi:hypothetical protein